MKFVKPVVALGVLFSGAVAHADDWGTVGIISSTLGNNANRVCVGAPDSTRPGDFGCSSDAPYVDLTTGNVGIGTTFPSSTLHVYGGASSGFSAITFKSQYNHEGVLGTDNNNAWLGSGNSTGTVNRFNVNDVRLSLIENSQEVVRVDAGKVGIQTGSALLATLDVSGTISSTDAIQVGTSSLSCSAGIPGAIRYNSGTLELCDGSTWSALGSGGSALSLSDTDGDTTITVENTGDTDTISFTTAGTERMVVDASGNVGIGVNDPDQKLEVSGNIKIGPNAYIVDGFNNEQIRLRSTGFVFNEYGKAGLDFRVESDTEPYALVLKGSTGDIGVGNNDPSATLHVTGTVSTTDAIQVGTSSLGCTAGLPGAIRYNSGTLELCDGSTWSALGSDGSALSLSDTDGDTTITVENTGDTDTISFTTAGTERMVIDANGNVGIGTGSPSAKVHVISNPGDKALILRAGSNSANLLEGQYSNGNRNFSFDLNGYLYTNRAFFGNIVNNLGRTAITSSGDGASALLTMKDAQTPTPNLGVQLSASGTTHFTGGNVGIGTTAPDSTLDVSGSIQLSQTGSETCAGAGDIGRIRVTADGTIQICRQ